MSIPGIHRKWTYVRHSGLDPSAIKGEAAARQSPLLLSRVSFRYVRSHSYDSLSRYVLISDCRRWYDDLKIPSWRFRAFYRERKWRRNPGVTTSKMLRLQRPHRRIILWWQRFSLSGILHYTAFETEKRISFEEALSPPSFKIFERSETRTIR